MATAGVGSGPNWNTSMPTDGEARDQRGFDHVAGEPRILADHHAMAMIAAREDAAGRHAGLHGDLGRHRMAVGAAADAVRAEQFAGHADWSLRLMIPQTALAQASSFPARGSCQGVARGAHPGSGARPARRRGSWVRMIIDPLPGRRTARRPAWRRRRLAALAPGQRPQEGLARNRHQNRQAKRLLQLRKPAQHDEGGLRLRPRKRPMPGSRISRSRAMPARLERREPAFEEGDNAVEDVGRGLVVAPSAGPSLLHRMHHDQLRVGRGERRVELGMRKAVNVVEIIDALRKRPALVSGAEAVDRERRCLRA